MTKKDSKIVDSSLNCTYLRDVIIDELMANKSYKLRASKIDDPVAKRAIDSIANDEDVHSQTLLGLAKSKNCNLDFMIDFKKIM